MQTGDSAASRCPVCGEQRVRRWRLARASDPHLAGRETYWLDRCAACGSAFTRDAETAPPQIYEAGTYSAERGSAAPFVEWFRRLADRDRLRFFDAVPPGGRVLELGAGAGELVVKLGRAGFDARGIEPSPSAIEAAAVLGARVVEGTAESAEIDAASEDAVVIWHALEHLADPAETVARAAQWLVPGGRLIVGVPDLSSLQARIGGDLWFHQDVPRHRTHFSSAGLVRMLERSGLRVARVRHLLIEQNPFGMWQTLLNRLTGERDFFFRLVKRDLAGVSRAAIARDLAITAVAGPILLAPAVGLELGAGLVGKGGTMVVEATR